MRIFGYYISQFLSLAFIIIGFLDIMTFSYLYDYVKSGKLVFYAAIIFVTGVIVFGLTILGTIGAIKESYILYCIVSRYDIVSNVLINITYSMQPS